MAERFVVLVTTTPTIHDATRELASRLARRANAVLVFLHVLPLRDGVDALHATASRTDDRTEVWVRRQRPALADVSFRHRVEVGEPAKVVARWVDEHPVELVVVEEPPRSWVSHVLWRSTAERIVSSVPCPVVIGGPGFLRSVPPLEPPPISLQPATVAELLNATVEARVDALRRWMDHMSDAAARIAASRSVEMVVSGLHRDDGPERRLSVELEEHRRALHAIGWHLSSSGRSWGAWRDQLPPAPVLGPFLAQVRRDGRSTSVPMAVDDDVERLVILAGARVPDTDDGVILLVLDAEDEFLRILGQPGPLPTFETYAFDAHGWMLSYSRFPEHLQDVGLLAAHGSQTPLRVRVAVPSDGPLEEWPLTWMAQRATEHKDGWDTRGYRDYRGAQVIGAWRWLEGYGFGVAAEVDSNVVLG